MAKAKSAPAKAAAPELKKGDNLTFLGYEELEDGIDPIFEQGDKLVVVSVKKEKDGSLKVEAAKADDKDVKDTIFFPGEAEVFVEKKTNSKKAAKVQEVDEDEEDETEEDEIDEDDDVDADDETDEDEDQEDDEDAEEEDEPAPKAKASKSKSSAKPKAAPARTKEEEAEEKIEHFASVKKIVKKGTADMLEAAKSLVNKAGEAYFNLGGILAEIYTTKAYGELGYNKDKIDPDTKKKTTPFEQYLNKELGIEYRKAMDLINIYKVFSKIEGIDEAKILKLGYTKMRAVARVAEELTNSQLNKLLDKADKIGRDELEEHITTSYVDATKSSGKQKSKKVTYKFACFDDENEYVANAIKTAQGLIENGSDVGEAIKHIIREWATMTDGVEIALDDAITVIEKRFGVKLEIVQDATEAKAEAKPKAKAAVKTPAKKAAPAKVEKPKAAAKKPAAKAPAKKAKVKA